MKASYLAVVHVFFCLFGVNLFAQDGPPPPPPPLIWKAPAPSELKRYVNPSKGFSVDFVGDPKVNEGVGVMSHYTVKRSGSQMYVRVIEFTREDLQKVTVPEILAQVKAAYGTTRDYQLVGPTTEKPDSIDFAATNKYYFRRVNARVVDGRLYELYIDVVNWHILQDHYAEKVKDFNVEADRFFKSFVLTK